MVAYAPAVDGFQERVKSAMAVFSPRLTVTFRQRTVAARNARGAQGVAEGQPHFLGALLSRDQGPRDFSRRVPARDRRGRAGADLRVAGYEPGQRRGRRHGAEQHRRRAQTRRDGPAHPRGTRARDAFQSKTAAVQPIFDWRALQRWGIDESALPAGAEIRYRVPTVWELYGIYIVAALVVVTAQLVLIAGLLRERARVRRAHQRDPGERSVVAQQLPADPSPGRPVDQRARSDARRDRPRFARRHVPEAGAMCRLSVSRLRRATQGHRGPGHAAGVRSSSIAISKSALDGIRRLSHDLHPAHDALLGLAPALRAHCDEVAQRNAVEVQFSGDEPSAPCIPTWPCACSASSRNRCETASCMAAPATSP